jgi:hypothetical protein
MLYWFAAEPYRIFSGPCAFVRDSWQIALQSSDPSQPESSTTFYRMPSLQYVMNIVLGAQG